VLAQELLRLRLKSLIDEFILHEDKKLSCDRINLADFGSFLKKKGFDYKKYNAKLKNLLEDHGFFLEPDEKIPPVYYLKISEEPKEKTPVLKNIILNKSSKFMSDEDKEIENSRTTYLNALNRHLKTCRYAVENISFDNEDSTFIFQSIYYLSGYIFECLFWYTILSLYKKNRTEYESCIKKTKIELNIVDVIEFKLKQHHRFQTEAIRLIDEILNEKLNENNFIEETLNKNDVVFKMFYSWSTGLRYHSYSKAIDDNKNIKPRKKYKPTENDSKKLKEEITNFIKCAENLKTELESKCF